MPPRRPRRRRCRLDDATGANGGPPARPPLHPWLDYPPNFKRAVAKNVAAVQRTLHPSIIFAPLPAELKYSLTRNFGFFTKIFTLPFDKVRATYPYRRSAPPTVPPSLAATPRPLSSSRGLSDGARVHELVRSDPSRAVPSSPALAHLRNPPPSSNPQDGVKTVQQSVGLGK